ncbi:hypothetical protein JXD38_06215 [candidate division WOR-3 bacterium]|nr:hypothetical protein [candidate division WOR-3 bacterium]
MSVTTAVRRRVSRDPIRAPKPAKREPQVSKLEGLCATCNHAGTCSYIRNSSQPVLFCEEFDSFLPPVVEEAVDAPAPTLEDMKNWDEYKGLCVNCELRETCAIRKPETGIWHCEEYK